MQSHPNSAVDRRGGARALPPSSSRPTATSGTQKMLSQRSVVPAEDDRDRTGANPSKKEKDGKSKKHHKKGEKDAKRKRSSSDGGGIARSGLGGAVQVGSS
jgi:hypothetical protein